MMVENRKTMTPEKLLTIARLLAECNNAEKCVGHWTMVREIIADDHCLRFHWTLTKGCTLACLPTDHRLWHELLKMEGEMNGFQGGLLEIDDFCPITTRTSSRPVPRHDVGH